MTDQSPREVALKWMAAVVSGDVETAVGLSDPSIIYTTGQVRRYEGHEGIRDIASDFARMAGFLDVSVEGEILEVGEVVAFRRLELYTIPSGGIEIRGCSFVEVEDGVVTRWSDYKSMESIDRVIG